MTRRTKPAPPATVNVHADPDAELVVLASALVDPDGAAAVAAEPAALWTTERASWIAAAIRTCHHAGTLDNLSLRRAAPAEARILELMIDGLSWDLVAHHLDTLRSHLRSRVAVDAANRAAERMRAGESADAALAELRSATAVAEVAHALPSGYWLGPAGELMREATDDDAEPVRVAPCLISLVGRGVDVTTGLHVVTLRWPVDGQQTSHTFERAHVAVSRKLAEVGAGVGLPVTSETARELVRYIAACEESQGLPVTRSARQTGWHGSAFLLGATRIGDRCPEWMRHATGCDGQVDAIRAVGEWSAWRDAAAEAASYPAVRITIAAALLPPLLAVLGAPSFCLHLGSETSTGKTSALQIALSIYGEPARLLSTWDTTTVGMEMAAAALSCLPLTADDTQRAARPEVCATTVYAVTQGVGRQRGAPGGALGASTRPPQRWQTVLLSTGEGPMPMTAHAGGARARVLHIGLPPWGRSDIGDVVRRVVGTCVRHHGHAARRWVEHLVALTDDDRRDLVARYQQATSDRHRALAAMVPTAPAIDRVAQYLGALDVVAELAADVLDLDLSLSPEILASVAAGMGEIDRARAALEHAYQWAVSRSAQVYTGGGDDPPGGWIGTARRSDSTLQDLALLPVALDAELARAGYDVPATLATWQRRGWLCPSEGRATAKVSVGGVRVRAYKFSQVALNMLDVGSAVAKVTGASTDEVAY